MSLAFWHLILKLNSHHDAFRSSDVQWIFVEIEMERILKCVHGWKRYITDFWSGKSSFLSSILMQEHRNFVSTLIESWGIRRWNRHHSGVYGWKDRNSGGVTMVRVFTMMVGAVCRYVDRSKHSLFQPEDLSYPCWCGKHTQNSTVVPYCNYFYDIYETNLSHPAIIMNSIQMK